MTVYDRDGYPVDLGSVPVDDLNALVRESIDMLRRQVNPSKRYGNTLKATLDQLNYQAVRFTDELYAHRKHLHDPAQFSVGV